MGVHEDSMRDLLALPATLGHSGFDKMWIALDGGDLLPGFSLKSTDLFAAAAAVR